jgi:hypothetical protein
MKVWFLSRFYELMFLITLTSLINNSFKAFAGFWDGPEEVDEPQHLSWDMGQPDNLVDTKVIFEDSCTCPQSL